MKVDQSAVTMNAAHVLSSECEVRVVSECSFRKIFNEVSQAESAPIGGLPQKNSQLLLMLEALISRMLEFITGCQETQVFELSKVRETDRGVRAAMNNPVLQGIEMEWKTCVTESIREYERTEFSSTGKVQTIDGRLLDFNLQVSMCRSFECERLLTQTDKVVLRDPLVINFLGQSVELSGKRFEFDLDADGKTELVHALGSGSGYLAIDSNADGRINDGSELFGALSGNGFADLAKFDDDKNNWLDESDAAFNTLRIWQGEMSDEAPLSTLRDHNIGAIYLGSAETPFALTDTENHMLAWIRASGIFLREDGSAGTVQQVDLAV